MTDTPHTGGGGKRRVYFVDEITDPITGDVTELRADTPEQLEELHEEHERSALRAREER